MYIRTQCLGNLLYLQFHNRLSLRVCVLCEAGESLGSVQSLILSVIVSLILEGPGNLSWSTIFKDIPTRSVLLEGARRKELGGSRKMLEQGNTSASFAEVFDQNT